MEIYIPKIVAHSPTKLPLLEKIIFYYILDNAFKGHCEKNNPFDLEIDASKLLGTLSSTTIEFEDIKSQVRYAISNLEKINLSLIDSNFHIKLSPIESVYQLNNLLYVTLNPIIIDYIDLMLDGKYVALDMLKIYNPTTDWQ